MTFSRWTIFTASAQGGIMTPGTVGRARLRFILWPNRAYCGGSLALWHCINQLHWSIANASLPVSVLRGDHCCQFAFPPTTDPAHSQSNDELMSEILVAGATSTSDLQYASGFTRFDPFGNSAGMRSPQSTPAWARGLFAEGHLALRN